MEHLGVRCQPESAETAGSSTFVLNPEETHWLRSGPLQRWRNSEQVPFRPWTKWEKALPHQFVRRGSKRESSPRFPIPLPQSQTINAARFQEHRDPVRFLLPFPLQPQGSLSSTGFILLPPWPFLRISSHSPASPLTASLQGCS